MKLRLKHIFHINNFDTLLFKALVYDYENGILTNQAGTHSLLLGAHESLQL